MLTSREKMESKEKFLDFSHETFATTRETVKFHNVTVSVISLTHD